MTSKAGNALKTVGKDIEEGSAALAVFADQGIKGERAGTLLTNTIFGLTENAQKNAGAFESLGIEVFDAEGGMKNFSAIAEDLTGAFEGMTEEQKLAEISQLGFTKQTREGVLALVGQTGTLEEYEEALRNAGGTAEEVAAKQMDTLEGDMILLNSAFESASVQIGGAFEPAVRGVIQPLTALINNVTPVLIDQLEIIAPKIQEAGERFGAFIEQIGSQEGRIKFLKDVNEDLSRFFSAENFEQMFASINEFRNQLILGFLEALPGIIEGLTAALPGIITFISETMLPMILDSFVLIIDALVDTLDQVVPVLIEGLAQVLPEILDAIAQILPQLVETLAGLIPTFLEAAINFFL